MGTIAGADLATGDIAYQRKNGTVQDLSPIPIKLELGVPGIGGPIITKGGVAFLSAATENNFRAYDLKKMATCYGMSVFQQVVKPRQ
ncbi:hypothetical protein [Psychrobacter sp. JCM 18901]|uniref:hypothetical protein n=1 Tax=Psychrobacter sp. JCM 18901 TaxID=1298609 RepID=UPI0004BB4A21|nr:hypothetical protein [Psychrobacter sp. JCM 18901]